MSGFQNFETSVLIDLLAQHTQRLTKLFTKNEYGSEYHKCKKIIEDLQVEINTRKKSEPVTNSSNRGLQQTQKNLLYE